MIRWIFLISLPIIVASFEPNDRSRYYISYKCVAAGKCVRTARPEPEVPSGVGPSLTEIEHSTMAACRLSCFPSGALWPLPTGRLSLGYEYTPIHHSQFIFDTSLVPDEVKSFVDEMSGVFINNLRLFGNGENLTSENTISVIFIVRSSNLNLDWNTNESYALDVDYPKTTNRGQVKIVAETAYGARHGLETLLQLTAPAVFSGNRKGLVILRSANITDSPAFAHRGLTLDTARNFVSVPVILKTIDGLSSCKMNVLHWHATDSQSFPLQLKRVPQMSIYGAYSPAETYSSQDIEYVIAYGKTRGVRIILELDVPAHIGAGWEWGEEAGFGSLAICMDAQPWRTYCYEAPCGQLNPANQNIYNVLRDIYRDLMDIWGFDAVFHMGGDEVQALCWNSTKEVTDAMELRGMGRNTSDFQRLWSEFHNALLHLVDEERGGIDMRNVSTILWSSGLTASNIIKQHLDSERYIIQTWVPSDDPLPEQLLDLGYRLIISTKNAWYLDHGVWGTTTYYSWKKVYSNPILQSVGVLGGEVASWGEYVDGESLDSRIWPRTAAAAERLWTNPLNISLANVESRLQNHRDRLKVRGIHPAAIAPQWCAQHDAYC